MNKKAFTVAEALATIIVGAFLIGIVAGVVIIGRNTWIRSSINVELQQKARFGLEKLIMELEKSEPSRVTIQACVDVPGNPCSGNLVRFQTPQTTAHDHAGSYFLEDPAGQLKWGGDNFLNNDIIYLVPSSNFSPTHLGRLVRIRDTTTQDDCGDDDCVAPEDPFNCPIDCWMSFLKKFFLGTAFAQELGGEGDYNITVIADNIESMVLEGFDQEGNPKDENPDFITITVTASKSSILGGVFSLVLTSSVALRN
ncbi:PilW family protein [Candidatus Omnitrophota bacterium]